MPAIRDGSPNWRVTEGLPGGAALLVGGLEPVPTLRAVGRLRLLGISNEAQFFLRQHVHARTSGKVPRRLSAAVEHDEQGQRLPGKAAGDI